MAQTFADVAAMRLIANRFEATAQLLETAARNHLSQLAFGGASAGRSHIARGDTLRASLDRLSADVSQWARATAEVTVALRAAADRYGDAELRSAARIG